MMQYVAGLLYDKNCDNVVLVKKLKFPKGCDWSDAPYNAVGGKIEANETPVEAMVREFKEETDADTTALLWEHFVTLENPFWRVYFFCAADQDAFNAAKTNEAEPIVKQYVPGGLQQVRPNILWLSALALDPERQPGAVATVLSR